MTTRHTLATAITWLVAFLIIPLPLILVLNQGLIDTQINVIAIDLGVYAYTWWLTIVYLSARPKWLEKRIGLPSMYFLHAMLGIFAMVAAFLHKNTLFSMHALIRNTGNIAFYLEIFLLIYAAIFMSGWFVDRLSFMRRFKESINHVLKHQVSLWLHRLNFIAIALIFLHVNLIPRIARLYEFVLLFDFYTIFAVASYAYKKVITDYDKNNGVVSKILQLNNHLIEITVSANEKVANYHAGDFYFLSVVNNQDISKESHPFSVISNPHTSADIIFQIDKLGDYTKSLSHLNVGDRVRLEGPFGIFNNEVKNYNGPIVLYGLGSGIAPLISLANEYADKKTIHVIWSQANITGKFYKQEMQKLHDRGVKVDFQVHRFSQDHLHQIISSEEKRNARFFVVGSGPVVLQVEKNLVKLGVKDKNIFDERMTI